MKVRIHADWRRLEAAASALRRDSGEVLVEETVEGRQCSGLFYRWNLYELDKEERGGGVMTGHMGFKVGIVFSPFMSYICNTDLALVSRKQSIYLFGLIVPNSEGL